MFSRRRTRRHELSGTLSLTLGLWPSSVRIHEQRSGWRMEANERSTKMNSQTNNPDNTDELPFSIFVQMFLSLLTPVYDRNVVISCRIDSLKAKRYDFPNQECKVKLSTASCQINSLAIQYRCFSLLSFLLMKIIWLSRIFYEFGVNIDRMTIESSSIPVDLSWVE